ncbi:MAG TPA: ATP-binding protein [Gemmatimonadaceae bacterium]|nr:ATP-binding protein [Gemmatimonadaceae bacterium]
MTLAKQLVLGSLVLVVLLVAAVVALSGGRLETRLVEETTAELTREARLIGLTWKRGIDTDALADSAGVALQRRVTLIDSAGVVRGDSHFNGEELQHLENHSTRPEVVAARQRGLGVGRRRSASAGDDELYVAIRHPLGFVRVSISTATLRDIVSGARRDVLVAGLIAVVWTLLLAYLFSRSVTRPVVELRDVARDIAAGDLDRRPSISAPGEVGDLAVALHRMSEQLANRLHALEADDALMSALVESINEGVVAVSGRGTVVRMNESSRRFLGVESPVPFPADRLPQEPAVRAALRDAMSGTATEPREMLFGGRTLALTARPLPDGGAVLALLDLTTRRRLETIRRDFVANVSHELKTPLTVISGFAETLLDHDLSVTQRQQFVGTIQTNVVRMQRIVDDLLDLARYESGGWVPNPVSVDVNAAAAEALALVQGEATRKKLDLRATIAPGAERAAADPTALRQILQNLVENAVRYTPTGSVTVFTEPKENGTVVGVRDTGIGIPREHLPRIFERFYRVDAGRSREVGGTGLGLAIVKHLAEAHGGTVRATSTVGGGTEIAVFFPDA